VVPSLYFLDAVSQLKLISILLKEKKICMLDERQKNVFRT